MYIGTHKHALASSVNSNGELQIIQSGQTFSKVGTFARENKNHQIVTLSDGDLAYLTTPGTYKVSALNYKDFVGSEELPSIEGAISSPPIQFMGMFGKPQTGTFSGGKSGFTIEGCNPNDLNQRETFEEYVNYGIDGASDRFVGEYPEDGIFRGRFSFPKDENNLEHCTVGQFGKPTEYEITITPTNNAIRLEYFNNAGYGSDFFRVIFRFYKLT